MSDQNSTSAANAANNESNNIALAAAILAAGAFIISLLQAVLQYVSSGEARYKCNHAAIHASSKQAKHMWAMRSWKVKSYYPQLNFGLYSVLRAAWKNELNGIRHTLTLDAEQRDDVAWRSLHSDDVLKLGDICDGVTALYYPESNAIMHSKDLTWKDWRAFWMWRLRRRLYPMQRSRATWSQALLALGVVDTKEMFRRTVDADAIPQALDVPIQYVKLWDIGVLAFALGFTSVSIDFERRDFRAVSPWATITSEDVIGFGKVLRFEGDIFEIHLMISRCYTSWLQALTDIVNGIHHFGHYRVNDYIMPLTILTNAIKNGETQEEIRHLWKDQVVDDDPESIERGNLIGEADLFYTLLTSRLKIGLEAITSGSQDNQADPFENAVRYWRDEAEYGNVNEKLRAMMAENFDSTDCRDLLDATISEWQIRMRCSVPTIFIASTFMSVCGLNSAYPSRTLLSPLLEFFRHEACKIAARQNVTFQESSVLQQAVAEGTIPWLREGSTFLFCTGTGGDSILEGTFSWGTVSYQQFFRDLPDAVREELLPTDFRYEDVRSSGEKKRAMTSEEPVRSGETSDSGASPRGRQRPLIPNTLIMPHTLLLLRHFHPVRWAKKLRSSAKYIARKRFRVENLIWLQVIILDIAIRLTIRNGDVEKMKTDHFDRPELSRRATLEKALEGQKRSSDRGDSNASLRWMHPETTVVEAITNGWKSKRDRERDAWERRKENGSDGDENAGGAEKRESPDEHLPLPKPQKDSTLASGADPSTETVELEEWDLASDLDVFCGVDFGADPVFKSKRLQKLADLLKLRGLFVIALLMIAPDSSDVFRNDDSTVEMPMI